MTGITPAMKLDKKFITLVKAFLQPYAVILTKQHKDIDGYAEIIFLSLQSVKNYAQDIDYLRKIHTGQIAVFTSALDK